MVGRRLSGVETLNPHRAKYLQQALSVLKKVQNILVVDGFRLILGTLSISLKNSLSSPV